MLDGTAIGDVVVRAHGIYLVPALNGSHRLANLDEPARRALLGAVNGLCQDYETVVVDTPAGIGETAMTLTPWSVHFSIMLALFSGAPSVGPS